MRLASILFIIISVIILSSCATIMGGKKNTISTKVVDPPEAKVFLNNREIGQGVFKIKVSKYDLQEGDVLVIKKDGYINDTIIIERKINEWYTVANIVTTLGIGIIIDVASGNIYRPNTQNIEIKLKKKEASK